MNKVKKPVAPRGGSPAKGSRPVDKVQRDSAHKKGKGPPPKPRPPATRETDALKSPAKKKSNKKSPTPVLPPLASDTPTSPTKESIRIPSSSRNKPHPPKKESKPSKKSSQKNDKPRLPAPPSKERPKDTEKKEQSLPILNISTVTQKSGSMSERTRPSNKHKQSTPISTSKPQDLFSAHKPTTPQATKIKQQNQSKSARGPPPKKKRDVLSPLPTKRQLGGNNDNTSGSYTSKGGMKPPSTPSSNGRISHEKTAQNRRSSQHLLAKRGNLLIKSKHKDDNKNNNSQTLRVLCVSHNSKVISQIQHKMHVAGIENVQFEALPLPQTAFSKSIKTSIDKANIIVSEPSFIAQYLDLAQNTKWIQSTEADILPLLAKIDDNLLQQKEWKKLMRQKEREMKDALDQMRKEREEMEGRMGDVAIALQQAQKALTGISVRSLSEIASLRRPPEPVKLCITAACCLVGMGLNVEWKNVKKSVANPQFIARCLALDPLSITENVLDTLETKFLNEKNFNVDIITKCSQPAGLMAQWILAAAKVAKIGVKMGFNDAEKRWREKFHLLGLLQNSNGEYESPELALMRQQNDHPANFRITKVAGIFGPHVAEYVLGRIIEEERSFSGIRHAQEHKKSFDYRNKYSYRGLSQLKVGIMGAHGDVGTCVSSVMKRMGLTVVGLSSKNRTPTNYVDEWHNSLDKTGMISFLRSGLDYIVNCLPDNPTTVDLLNSQTLFANKAESAHRPLYISVGSPRVISESDLLHVLSNKKAGGGIRGAVLDTFENDILSSNSKLWNFPNVIISPHIASLATMCASGIADIFVTNLKKFMDKKTLMDHEHELPHMVEEKKKLETTRSNGGSSSSSANSTSNNVANVIATPSKNNKEKNESISASSKKKHRRSVSQAITTTTTSTKENNVKKQDEDKRKGKSADKMKQRKEKKTVNHSNKGSKEIEKKNMAAILIQRQFRQYNLHKRTTTK